MTEPGEAAVTLSVISNYVSAASTTLASLCITLASLIDAWLAGDKKGKGKAVEKPTRKRTRGQREWDRALAVPDTQGQPRRFIRIRETQAEGQRESLAAGVGTATQSVTVATQGNTPPTLLRAYASHSSSSTSTSSSFWSTDPRWRCSETRRSCSAITAVQQLK
ncbi:hypothetical protein C2845_PM01G38850 [Panicum miliaceum]|uniref:Uncharacterized protein n=1 Tax=Panicum miliaceum TaxID=4540 RepID=A0A3L6TM11_PANMI|nr:hypothetical protein C2845_PM01G38850 [Panicum miliaceum]